MRPSDITDGITRHTRGTTAKRVSEASMRPSDITDGIPRLKRAEGASTRMMNSFNEAVGYYRRNPGRYGAIDG